MNNKGKKRMKTHVLLLCESVIPSIWLCGDGQLSILEQEGKIEYRRKETFCVTKTDLLWSDVVVLARLDTAFALRIARLCHDARKYVIYMMDDDLLNVPEHLSVSEHYSRLDVRRNISEMIGISNALLSTSQRILNQYGQEKENCFRIDGFAEESPAFESHIGNKQIKIGFAGSLDRKSDVDFILKDALCKIHQKYGERVCFEFFGVKPDYAEQIQAKFYPYVDSYARYRECFFEMKWDIGLAPMPKTDFHACKYINKYIEYASAGTVGVFSAVEPYLELNSEMGIGALCANTTKDWYEALCRLVEQDEERESLRKTAYTYVQKEMNIHTASERFYKQLGNVLTYKAPENVRIHGLLRDKTKYVFEKSKDVIQKYGLKLPIKVIDKIVNHIYGSSHV